MRSERTGDVTIDHNKSRTVFMKVNGQEMDGVEYDKDISRISNRSGASMYLNEFASQYKGKKDSIS